MAKTGRNQPCPCGSGKKYKKCCLNKPIPGGVEPKDELNDLMQEGYTLLEKKQIINACEVWLYFWNKLKMRFTPDIVAVEETDSIFSGTESVHNWCQDFESELENAGRENEEYYQKRIEYCTEFCSFFPKSSSLIMHNMKRAAAESHFALNKYEQGDKLFEALIREYPENIWGYIGWGDMYFLAMKKSQTLDFEKAEKLYTMALGKNLEDEQDLIDRLEDLKRRKNS